MHGGADVLVNWQEGHWAISASRQLVQYLKTAYLPFCIFFHPSMCSSTSCTSYHPNELIVAVAVSQDSSHDQPIKLWAFAIFSDSETRMTIPHYKACCIDRPAPHIVTSIMDPPITCTCALSVKVHNRSWTAIYESMSNDSCKTSHAMIDSSLSF